MLFLKGSFQSTIQFFLFGTQVFSCTFEPALLWLLVADQKVELHRFSYVGAVIQKTASAPFPSPRRRRPQAPRPFQRGWPHGRRQGGRVDGENRNRERERIVGEEINVKLCLPFHRALGEGEEGAGGRGVGGSMKRDGTGGHLRSIKNQ